jgi:hypothetical protein
VRHEKRGRVQRRDDRGERGLQVHAAQPVERGQRLVEQQDRRVADERARESSLPNFLRTKLAGS